MTEFLQYAVLGLGIAAVYSLLASGVVVIYRGTGVVNFAHGAFALIGAIVYTELNSRGWAPVPALVLATLAGAVVGVLMQNPIMWTLRSAAPLARIIATLGVLIAIQAAASLHYADASISVPQFLPRHAWSVVGVTLQSDRLLLYVIAVVVTSILWLAQSRLRVGLATRASAENEVAVVTLGWSPGRLATLNWAVGGALAGLAGALVVPVTGLLVDSLVLLIVPALAAALLGRFDSIWAALAGATGIGIGQSLVIRYVHQTGAGDAFPFLVIILMMVLAGRALPLRSHVYERLPSLGTGRISWPVVAVCVAVGLFCMLSLFNITWQDAFTVSFAVSVVLLSVVVVTGYAGQLSLAQFAIAGLGAYVAGRLVSSTGIPFWAAVILGMIAAVPIGAIFALPALRTRGVNLAVITLGLAVSVSALLFNNTKWTGGFTGTPVGSTKLFGLDIDAVSFPDRYGAFVFLAFVACALVVANLRRSSAGRKLIAIRENERAAASLGVSVTGAKLYAFMVASAIAALGGTLIAFRNPSIVYTDFSPLQSVYSMAYAVIGGLGYVIGPILGSTFTSGGIGSLFNGILSGIDNDLVLIGGCVVVVTLMLNPDGLIPGNLQALRAVGAKTGLDRRWAATAQRLPRRRRGRATSDLSEIEVLERTRVPARTLEVRDLSVRFGGVTAVDGASITVAPGEIVGLIGPNGAGKTTFIDAVTGFVRAANGQISLDGVDITRRVASRRAQAGVCRSWQSLELFEDVTVMENLQVASDAAAGSWSDNLTSLVRPGKPKLGAAAAAAVQEFELAEDLGKRPGDLSYGRRRLVGIARAVALNPSILLLDEPAAGLSSRESEELGHLLRRLAESWGMGILLVEHDVDLVMSASHRVVVLNFGKVIATGTPKEIGDHPAVRAAYLGPVENAPAVEAPKVLET